MFYGDCPTEALFVFIIKFFLRNFCFKFIISSISVAAREKKRDERKKESGRGGKWRKRVKGSERWGRRE
jgi:hypothetical protein